LCCCCCSLEEGTTYNAYLIFGDDYTALVDASHEKFGKLFMQTLKDQLKKAGRGIDYIVVSAFDFAHLRSGGHRSIKEKGSALSDFLLCTI
jgi:flavorubredoxin